MSKQHVNTFSGGMDRDTSLKKYEPNRYYDGRNFRVINNEALSSGAITNVKAPKERLETPYIMDGANKIVFDQLHSAVSIRNNIVLFSSNGEWSGIFLYEDDDSPYLPLKKAIFTDYNSTDLLGFPEGVQAVGRYELPFVQKVYWAVKSKVLRVLNIYAEDSNDYADYSNAKSSDFDIVAAYDNIPPQVEEVLPGGSLKSGKIQYFYTQFNKYGAETPFSGLSELVPLSSGEPEANGLSSFVGDLPDENINKAVAVRLPLLDSKYDYVRLYSVHYSQYGQLPSIKLVSEHKVVGSSMRLIDSGDYLEEVPIEELNHYGSNTFTAEHIKSKDNILFAANINTHDFDIDFDARAYRFNSSGKAVIHDSPTLDGDYIEINPDGSWVKRDHEGRTLVYGTDWNIPKEHNAINSYNREDYVENDATGAYCFNPNTGKFGGLGKHISYDVFMEERLLMPLSSEPECASGEWLDSNTFSYKASFPYFKRGETYRFGIVFFNRKMTASPVKWIGDIKMPYISQNDDGSPGTSLRPFAYCRDATTNTITSEDYGILYDNNEEHDIYSYGLRVHFVVDLNGVDGLEDVSGFQIVRVKREEKDRSVLGTGFIQRVGKSEVHSVWCIDDLPFKPNRELNEPNIKRKGAFISPEITIGKLKPQSYSNLKFRRVYDFLAPSKYFSYDFNVSAYTGSTEVLGSIISTTSLLHRNQRSLSMILRPILGGSWFSGWDPIKTTSISDIKRVEYPAERKKMPTTIGSGSESWSYIARARTSHNSPGLDNWRDGSVTFYTSTASAFLTKDDIFTTDLYTMVDLIRDVSLTQYGGLTYEARGYNKYIPASKFLSISPGWNDNFIPAKPSLFSSLVEVREDCIFFKCPIVYKKTPSITDYEPGNFHSVAFWRNYDIEAICIMAPIEDLDSTVAFSTNTSVLDDSLTIHDVFEFVDGKIKFDRPIHCLYDIVEHDYLFWPLDWNKDDFVDKYIDDGVFEVDAMYGDTFISMYQHMSCMWDKNGSGTSSASEESYRRVRQTLLMFPVESSINNDLVAEKPSQHMFDKNLWVEPSDSGRRGSIQEKASVGALKFPDIYPYDMKDLYTYNAVYSEDHNYPEYFPEIPLAVESKENDIMIYSSRPKTNGEVVDSWSKFGFNEFLEVDGQYGPITALELVNNNMIFFQPEGIGRLSINDRSLIQDDSGTALLLGTGGVLQRYDYIATNNGVQHRDHLVASDASLYFIDKNRKSIYILSDEGSIDISKLKGMSSYLYNSQMNNIICGYDPEYREALFTIDGETLVFSEFNGAFVSFYDIAPKYYFKHKSRLYSDINGISVHNSGNEFIGDKVSVAIVVNPGGGGICTFNVLDFRTDVFAEGENHPINSDFIYQTVDRIKFSNSYLRGSTSVVKPIILTDIRKNTSRLVRSWRTQVPLTPSGSRFVDSYLIATFEFDNRNGMMFKMHDLITHYRPTPI